MAPPALDLAVRRPAVRALPGPQHLPGRGMDALLNSLELLVRDLARETEFRGAAALPVADHPLPLSVVVAVHQMMRRIPLTVRHRANRQHADVVGGRPACLRLAYAYLSPQAADSG